MILYLPHVRILLSVGAAQDPCGFGGYRHPLTTRGSVSLQRGYTLTQTGQSGSVSQGFKPQILPNDDHRILLPSTSDAQRSEKLGRGGSPKQRI